jgi:hypothetical protein
VGDGLGDELLRRVVELGVLVLAIVAHEGMRELVAGDVDLRVDRLVVVDR